MKCTSVDRHVYWILEKKEHIEKPVYLQLNIIYIGLCFGLLKAFILFFLQQLMIVF